MDQKGSVDLVSLDLIWSRRSVDQKGTGFAKMATGYREQKDSFYLLIQGKMGVQRGKSHNEHLKYPASTGRRFYPE